MELEAAVQDTVDLLEADLADLFWRVSDLDGSDAGAGDNAMDQRKYMYGRASDCDTEMVGDLLRCTNGDNA